MRCCTESVSTGLIMSPTRSYDNAPIRWKDTACTQAVMKVGRTFVTPLSGDSTGEKMQSFGRKALETVA
jgi:hypothetical protein